MLFNEDITIKIEADPIINVSGSDQLSQIGVVNIESDQNPVYIQIQEPYAPVQSVNGKIGWVTINKNDIGLSNVENISIVNTSGILQSNINNLSGFSIDNFYLKSNPSGFVTGVDLSAYATIANLALTGQNLQQQINNINNSGFITGIDLSNYVTKLNGQFTNRPTLNGTGFLLSGEAANLSFSTGNFLYISSGCYTGNPPTLIGGYIDPKVPGYYYQESITEYYKIQPGGKLTWIEWNRNGDGKIEILSRDGVNDTPMPLYVTTNIFTSPPNFLNTSIIWKPNSNNGNPTGCMPKIFQANLEELLNYESDIITNQLPSTKNTVQEYKVHTPYSTTVGGYGYQFTKDTTAPEESYNSWLMLRDTIYDRTYNGTPIPLSAVFGQLLEFTSSIPSSPTGVGLKGAVAYDGRYLYICVNSNTWRRVVVSTW